MTITKSITLNGAGTLASIFAESGTSAITVNAGPTDVVVLRGLSLNGVGTGGNGIRILQARAVVVEDTTIEGFAIAGISFQAPVNGAELFVTNTDIGYTGFASLAPRPDSRSGIWVNSVTAANVAVDRCNIEDTNVGVLVRDNIRMTIRDSLIAGNSTTGVLAFPTGGSAEVNLENVVVAFNGGGIQAGGGDVPAAVRLSNVSVIGNNVGLVALSGGTFRSFLNNRIDLKGGSLPPFIQIQEK